MKTGKIMKGTMSRAAAWTVTAVMLASSLTGCGIDSPAAKRTLRQSPVASVPNAPAPQAPAAGQSDGARAILAAVAQATQVTKTWTAKAHSDVYAADGGHDYNTSLIVYKNPGVMAATVLEAKNDKTVKTKVIYKGGSDVDLKTYFFGFLAVKVNLPVTDSRMVDCYKRSLRDTQTKQLFEALLHPQATATYLGEGVVMKEAVDFLAVQSPASWKGVTREVVGISRRLNLPISRECFDARNKRVFQLRLENMRTNITVKPSDFSLD